MIEQYPTNFLLTFVLLFSSLSASESQKAFNKASYFEQIGNTKNAMLWYKKAALLSNDLKNKEPTQTRSKQITQQKKNTIFSDYEIKSYRSNYLLPSTYDFTTHTDRKKTETKFQISFKKALSKNLFGLQDKVYLAYTQTSWWQTSSASSPFRETNYEPEIFVQIPYKAGESILKFYKLGLIHQSNGRLFGSRSWNRAYVSGFFKANGLIIEPRVWYRFKERRKIDENDFEGDDNPDILNYLGYGDVKISYLYKNHLFASLLRKKAFEISWSFPIKEFKNIFVYLQFFNGYGESLIDYNKRVEKIGIGFAITR